jgi:hypothetical protein
MIHGSGKLVYHDIPYINVAHLLTLLFTPNLFSRSRPRLASTPSCAVIVVVVPRTQRSRRHASLVADEELIFLHHAAQTVIALQD